MFISSRPQCVKATCSSANNLLNNWFATGSFQTLVESCVLINQWNYQSLYLTKNLINIWWFTERFASWRCEMWIMPFFSIHNAMKMMQLRRFFWFCSLQKNARLRTLNDKIWVCPASFPSLSYINFGKIVLRSGKFQILFWRLISSSFYSKLPVHLNLLGICSILSHTRCKICYDAQYSSCLISTK